MLATIALATPVIAFRRPALAPVLGALAVGDRRVPADRAAGRGGAFTLAPAAPASPSPVPSPSARRGRASWRRSLLLASLWMPWFGAAPVPDVGNLAAPQLAVVLRGARARADIFTAIAMAALALARAALALGGGPGGPARRRVDRFPPEGLEPRTGAFIALGAALLATFAPRAGARRLRSAAMLSSDQVLHVARLARLELTPEEVERFGGELSKVLDHIELIGQLELEDVQPTSHVIDVENALRRRRATAVVARRDRARQRAGRRRRRVPRPEPGRVMIELTAKQAADAIRSGALDAAEYFEFYRDRAASDPYNSYIWVAEEAPEIDTSKPFAGVPIAIKDLFCTEGIPSQAGSKILEDYRPPYSATLGQEAHERRRRHAAGQDEPGRVRDGLLHRELRLRARP